MDRALDDSLGTVSVYTVEVVLIRRGGLEIWIGWVVFFSLYEASEDRIYFGVCIFDGIRLDNEWSVWGIHLIGILVPACILSDTRHCPDEFVDMGDEFAFVCDFHR